MDQEASVDMDKTKLNTSEVSRKTGKGRATIKRHADKGKISFELDDDGNRLFDLSEVERVYADDIRKVAIGKGKAGKTASEQDSVALKDTQDKLIAQYEARIEYLEKTLEKALDIPPLLENHSSEKKEWETLLATKTEKLASDTAQQMEELREKHKEDMGKLLGALRHEVNKSWLDKLLSRKKRIGVSKRNQDETRSPYRAG